MWQSGHVPFSNADLAEPRPGTPPDARISTGIRGFPGLRAFRSAATREDRLSFSPMGAWGLPEIDALVADVGARCLTRPTVGVVLGSGLGAFGDQLEQAFPYTELRGMPTSSVPGHAGVLKLGRVDGVGVACLQGRVHLYEGHDASAV